MMEAIGSVSVPFRMVLSWPPTSSRLEEGLFQGTYAFLYFCLHHSQITLGLGEVRVRDRALLTLLTQA